MLKIATILFLLIAVAVAAVFVVGPERLWRQIGKMPPSLDLAQWPGRSSPNWALSCPVLPEGASYCTGIAATHTSPQFDVEASELFDWLVIRISAEGFPSRTSESARHYSAVTVLEQDDVTRKVRFEFLTQRMKFPDIVDLEVVELSNGKASFALLSQSLIGHDDFGKNAALVTRLIQDAVDRFDVQ